VTEYGTVRDALRAVRRWAITWWNRTTRAGRNGSREAPVRDAIASIRAELEGGPRAHLAKEVRDLAELLLRRERRHDLLERDPFEHEILAAIPDAAALVSKEGWVRVSNAAFDTLAVDGRALGLTPLEITRSAELSEAVKRALEGTPKDLELSIGRRTFRAHTAPLLRGEVLLLLRDVTDAKRAEAARRDFVMNASHELKTPIAAIRAAGETLAHGGLDDREAARGFVEIIERNSARISRLVDDLLDLSRVESRQWTFHIAALDAAGVANAVVGQLAGKAQDKGLRLRSEIPEGVKVRADLRSLEQVLVNLVDNAVKYTHRGEVTVRADRDGACWVLSVVDTGPGIEAHHLPRLFERFYRVDPGRSREQGGTGLGLAIVKHLVQGMGGTVGVESGGQGSRFWARFDGA
jgi:two-component system phosphate regulon sensor histidine kinase PhoR